MSEPIAALIEAFPQPAVLTGATGRILAANSAAEGLFALQLTGHSHVAVLRNPELIEATDRALTAGVASEVRWLLRAGSRDMTFRVWVAPVPMPGGPGALATFEDITPLEQAGQMRRDFVANVSHELKTPLTAISGLIETLQGPARNDAQAQERFLAIMARESRRMGRLVEDLLSLSRVETDERNRPRAGVAVDAILRRACALIHEAVADADRISLTLGEGPFVVAGDADQLQQVMQNLMENALKYGRAGTPVIVSLRREPGDRILMQPVVRLDVEDRGDGIEAHLIPRLTERFYRIDAHRSRQSGGTGLGLAIVKHIVNRHRGRLAVTSEPGEGSVFSVYLPALDA